MTSFRIRPRFRKYTHIPLAELTAQLEAGLQQNADVCTYSIAEHHITIRIPENEQHYWSPQLNLSLEEEDGKTLIRGLYGPHPNIWMMFTFSYGALAVLGLFHAIIGLSMLQMGKSPWVLWTVLIEVCAAAGLYLSAQLGQKKGAEQLYRLHFLFEALVHEKLIIE